MQKDTNDTLEQRFGAASRTVTRGLVKLKPGEIVPPVPLLSFPPPDGYREESDAEFAARLKATASE